VLSAFTAASVALFLVPIGCLLVLRSRRDVTLAELALCIPVGFALDLLLTMLLARVVRLEVATWLSRLVFVALAGAHVARKRRRGERLEWPVAVGSSEIGAVLVGVVSAAFLSYSMSRWFWVWDREWHAPFAAVLRGETLPFHNVYEREPPLRYHHTGDVVVAMFQALSFDAMHSTRALGVSHDVMSALIGASIGLLSRDFLGASPWVSGLVALMVILAGPVQFLPFNNFEGLSDFSNITLTFRPHGIVAAVLLVGVGGALMAHFRHDAWDSRISALALVPMYALLSITDELSTALVGLSLGAAWLVRPTLLARRWFVGAGILVALVALILVSNRVFSGTLGWQDGPVNQVAIVDARIPGFFNTPVPVLERWPESGIRIVQDLPFLVPFVAILAAFALRPSWRDRAPLVFLIVIVVASVFAYFKVELNHRTFEGHRFVTAIRWLVPLMGLLWLARMPRGSVVHAVMWSSLAIGAMATLAFVYVRMDQKTTDWHLLQESEYSVDCRSAMGSRFSDVPMPTFIDDGIWYLYSGCRPVFSPGGVGVEGREKGVMAAGNPRKGVDAIRAFATEIWHPGEPLQVVCPRRGPESSICARARAIGACSQPGSDVDLCMVDGDRIQELAK
jgi:hypothetical protein